MAVGERERALTWFVVPPCPRPHVAVALATATTFLSRFLSTSTSRAMDANRLMSIGLRPEDGEFINPRPSFGGIMAFEGGHNSFNGGGASDKTRRTGPRVVAPTHLQMSLYAPPSLDENCISVGQQNVFEKVDFTRWRVFQS
jgi:hypothetical protein